MVFKTLGIGSLLSFAITLMYSDLSQARLFDGTSTRSSSPSWTCRGQAERALARGNNHIVFTMEGLTQAYAEILPLGIAKSGLVDKIRRSTNANFDVKGYSHLFGPSRIASCAQAWKQVHGSNLRVTIVGHSLGGGPALLAAAEKLQRKGINIDTLVSLDGRHSSDAISCSVRRRTPTYRQPDNVTRVISFRQCGGGLPGRDWVGRNVDNDTVGSSHVSVPYDPKVYRRLAGLLSGNTPGFQSDTRVASLDRDIASTNRTRFRHPITGFMRTRARAPRPGLFSASARAKWNKPGSKCDNGMGIFVDCTYGEASMINYRQDR